jgi:hypothetical protein
MITNLKTSYILRQAVKRLEDSQKGNVLDGYAVGTTIYLPNILGQDFLITIERVQNKKLTIWQKLQNRLNA